MGRHSRRGPADNGDTPAAPGTGRRRRRGVEDTPAHGTPRAVTDGGEQRQGPNGSGVRGGHPEQREEGGGWGLLDGAPRGPRPGPGQGAVRPGGRPPLLPGPRTGPRKEYLDAFDGPEALSGARGAGGAARGADGIDGIDDTDELDVFSPRRGLAPAVPPPRGPGGRPGPGRAADGSPAGGAGAADGGGGDDTDDTDDTDDADGDQPRRKGPKGRTYTGIAAAAVTTVLAVVVAGQVTRGSGGDSAAGATDGDRSTAGSASRSENRPSPAAPSAAPLTYDQKMAKRYPLAPKAKGSGTFDTVPGADKAPGKGRLFRYRVDVERGLGLDGQLFAKAVQLTLNDKRSWAHDDRAFERVSSGKPDFVITLASPGTTDVWCRKSGLDITEDNVSCDSAATDRVMINAYRWAQGAETYGDRLHPYRQMLINHEVGHRLGFNHVLCSVNGSLAPVMQQQTKFLSHDGITCKANPWPFPHA